jgi:hypothetical protein
MRQVIRRRLGGRQFDAMLAAVLGDEADLEPCPAHCR